MKIANIVDYLASKAKASEDVKGCVTIQETVYRINDNYTYDYYTEYKEALQCYADALNIIVNYGIFKNEIIANGVLKLDRIEVDYFDDVLSARRIYECLKNQDITLYEFEYKK